MIYNESSHISVWYRLPDPLTDFWQILVSELMYLRIGPFFSWQIQIADLWKMADIADTCRSGIGIGRTLLFGWFRTCTFYEWSLYILHICMSYCFFPLEVLVPSSFFYSFCNFLVYCLSLLCSQLILSCLVNYHFLLSTFCIHSTSISTL